MADSVRELERRHSSARKARLAADKALAEAKEAARKASEEEVAAYAELDRVRWIKTQTGELGVDPVAINPETLLIHDLPEGPTYDERPGA